MAAVRTGELPLCEVGSVAATLLSRHSGEDFDEREIKSPGSAIALALALFVAGFVWWRATSPTVSQADTQPSAVPDQKATLGEKKASPPTPPDLDQKITKLPTHHVYFEDELAMGYVDADRDVLYRWNGVFLPEKHFSSVRGFPSGEPVINGKHFKEVVTVDPPVSYLMEKSGAIRVGYLDRAHWAFLPWKRVELGKDEFLPNRKDGTSSVAVISDDFSTLVEIDAPKHMVEQPHRWKKIAKSK